MKLRLKENEVVHCRTEKEANKVLKIASKCGKSWCTGDSYIDNSKYHINKYETCYYLNEGQHGNITNVPNEYKVITAKEFIKRNKKNKTKQLALRVEALEAIVNATNDKVVIVEEEVKENGWYKLHNILYYFNFENKHYYGFSITGIWAEGYYRDVWFNKVFHEYTKATNEEVLQRLTEEAKRRGFNIDCTIISFHNDKYPAILDVFEYVEEENKLLYSGIEIMNNGKWAEVVKPYEPKVGDVVKAWNNDKCNFIFGIISKIDNDDVPYLVSGISWYRNVELAPEEVTKHFKRLPNKEEIENINKLK